MQDDKISAVIEPSEGWRKLPCPACGRKGLHYVSHPHAFGFKDYGRVECRFCHKRFAVEVE